MSDFEETIRRLQSEKGVVGIIVVDSAGRVIHSTIDSDATQSHTAFLQQLCEKTKASIRELDSSNDLTFLRLRTKKNEIMIAPDKDHVIMVIKDLS
ncbi:CRE-DYRB-1 protein [Caenorhabditis remanei]|uniref:Dynein light chain roadblock n=1 Tax=Caenorhabditis remanei TaxID=31234 RepID=E3LG69_CAERE|nr:CRE-DYRB-1 protein [Caenorhabditis remanei]